MLVWWYGLSALAQAFYAAAVFFSVLFLWQFFAAMSGLGGDSDGVDGADADASGADVHDFGHPGDDVHHDLVTDAQGMATFRLLSVRSIVAFGLLFSWGGALYLGQGMTASGALVRAALWGLAGMLVVAAFFWVLPRLSEEGTGKATTAVGEIGEVYIGLPAQGMGQVRVLLGGQVRFVKARTADGSAIEAGRIVKVTGVASDGALIVEASN